MLCKTTYTYTPMTINSLSARQQINSVKMYRESYGVCQKNTKMISCNQKHPRKKVKKIHDSQLKDSKRWSENGEKNGEIHNLLYTRMQILAQEEFNYDNFKRREYDSYSLILYNTLVTETNLQKRDLKYTNIFGDKWRNQDDISKIRERINDSLNECENFKSKERAFKKKYFQDQNYIIQDIDTL